MLNPQKMLESRNVEDIISKLKEDISPDDQLARARKVMRSEQMGEYPVVVDDKLEGVLRIQDILKLTSGPSDLEVSGFMVDPPILATPEWNLLKTARKMVGKSISILSIVENLNRKDLLGVVHIKDLLKVISPAGGEKPKISEIMNKDFITAGSEDMISKVWHRFVKGEIFNLPVVEGKKLVGMVSAVDLIRSGRARMSLEGEGSRRKVKVGTIMKGPPDPIDFEAPIKEGIEKLANSKRGQIPVVEEDELVGVINWGDGLKPYL